MNIEKPDHPSLEQHLARIQLLSLDCDGVMTDGGLYYGPTGDEMRRFNVRDGVGIKAVMAAGIEVAFITASKTPAIQHRARALGVAHCITGAEDKLGALEELCGKLGISLADVAHMGDDINDLPVLAKVGAPLTVADSVPDVRAVALFTSERNGGDGAVRDICERILAAKGVS